MLTVRRAIAASALLLAAGLLAPGAAAHGGQYKGPAADSGGSSGGGGPVTNPGGASTSAGSGAGGAAGAGASAGAPSGGRTSSPRGVAGGTGASLFADSTLGWEFWWEHNKDQFLEFRSASDGSGQGSAAGLTARGRPGRSAARASPEVVLAGIIPVLERLLGSENNRDILDSSVLAIARVTLAGSPEADAVADAIRPRLAHRELSVRSAAVLALGVLGSARQADLLRDLLRDDSAGRAAMGGSPVDWLSRAFAALSLGLIDVPEAVPDLIAAIDASPAAERDLKICSIVALGLMHDPARPQIVAYLQRRLADKSMDATVRSFIPTSLGKLGDPAALPALLAALLDTENDHAVRQSAAIGLGLLGPMGNEPVRAALMAAALGDGDAQTRHFCTMSLAQIGARDTDPTAQAEAHEALGKHFARQLAGPAAASDRAWVQLAAAIYGRRQAGAKPALAAALAAAYGKEKDPGVKGATAVALGLLAHEPLAPMLLADLEQSHDAELRGYLGIALGLMRHDPARNALRKLSLDTTVSPTLRLQAVTGLGLLRDPGAVDLLLAALGTAQTLGVSSAIARAVGLIGGQGSISSLAGLASDGKSSDLARAFACVALGLVGEKTDLPWN
ncbi:MAG TPA: HEAT repeat domain-containing protein, partial [Planctomycetota bacterium]|nr:HEAT repeat domain-containing protein [Planctomycetota bacterium]